MGLLSLLVYNSFVLTVVLYYRTREIVNGSFETSRKIGTNVFLQPVAHKRLRDRHPCEFVVILNRRFGMHLARPLCWLEVAGVTRGRLFRLLYILDRVRLGDYPNSRTLSEELGVSDRTIKRDLDLLRDDWGAPLEFDHGRNGFYLSESDWIPPVGREDVVRLTTGEAVALVLALQTFEAVQGHGLASAFRSLLEKLPHLLPEPVTVDLPSLVQHISFSFEPVRGDPGLVADRLALLRRAIEQRRVLVMRYYTASRDEETQRHLEPYHLRYYDGAWYVVGYCRWRKEVRTFAVDRIRHCEILDETFPLPSPERFSPDTYFGEAWRLQRGAERQRVVVRFSPEQARFVRGRVWHPTQETREEPDGSLVLAFRVLGLEEIMRWLLQFGSHVEVLEPPALRSAIAKEAERIVAIYRNQKTEVKCGTGE